MGWPTAKTVLQKAAMQLGLAQSIDIGDPYISTDINILQLLSMLETVGRDLVSRHRWSHLRKERIFSTARPKWNASTNSSIGSMAYSAVGGGHSLPPDFYDMTDDSMWNRSNRLPSSPVSAQEWQGLKSRLTGVVFNAFYRPMQGMLFTFPDNPGKSALVNSATGGLGAGQVLSYEYQSLWWVNQVSNQPLAYASLNYPVNTRVQAGQLFSATDASGPGGSTWQADTAIFIAVTGGVTQASVDGKARTIVDAMQPYNLAAGGVCPLDGGLLPAPLVAYQTAWDSVYAYPADMSQLFVDNYVLWNLYGWMSNGSALGEAEGNTTISTFGTGDKPTGAGDTLMFDEELLVAALKMKWLKERGFAWDTAKDDFEDRLDAAIGADVVSPTLSINPSARLGDVLIGPQSIPITGYGG